MLSTDKVTESINAKIKKLEEHIHDTQFFGQYKMNLINVLETFNEFCNNMSSYKNQDCLEHLLYSPYFENKAIKGKQDKEIGKIIHKHNESVKRLADLKEQKDLAYRPFNKVSYLLKSVTIHYGDLNSGHYYTYIRRKNEWFKFNDTVVKQVLEKTVFEDSQGKLHPFANCYCLFYSLEEGETLKGEMSGREDYNNESF